ncbi:MAG: hypothetical protein AAB362_00750 [Patescibacteria group bacterium]
MKLEKLLSQNASWIIISFVTLTALLTLYIFSQVPKENGAVNSNVPTESHNTANTTDISSTDSSKLRAEENALYVSEQKPGISILVNFAIFQNGGYVVVHENKNEIPETIIGFSQHLFRGEHKDLIIRLTRPIKSGESLYATLHTDDGDEVFNLKKDPPIYSRVNNEPMMMIFDIDDNANPDIPILL